MGQANAGSPAPGAPFIAARLVEVAARQSILFIASDEQRAAEIAAIASALSGRAGVVHLPSSDALPGDEAPASPANVGHRISALRTLRASSSAGQASGVIAVTTAEAICLHYPPPEAFEAAPPRLRVGDPIDAAAFEQSAAEIGYFTDDRIDEPGEIAIRGSVIDIFPADLPGPVRIEIIDGRIAEIRGYDPITQRATEPIESVELGRASEPPQAAEATLLEHLPGSAVASDPDVVRRQRRFLKVASEAAGARAAGQVVSEEDWSVALKARDTVEFAETEAPPPRFVERRDPSGAMLRYVRQALDGGSVLLAGSPRDLRFIGPRLTKGLKRDIASVSDWASAKEAPAGSLMSMTAPIDRGFAIDGLAVIAAGDLLGGRAGADQGAAGSVNPLLDVSEVRCGDVVIHEDHGIGAVVGLEELPGSKGESIVLEYAKGARRLVPVAEADRIWRYGADADAVTLDTLDGASWQKRRGEIEATIAESASTLAALAAEREKLRTDPILPDVDLYERFAAGFAFTETPDQAKAIAAVRADLASGKPMDRLVVGDVGYGKTEVALRAAAMAALAGRQVAIAAPTTVLVRQHLETFERRFADSGIEVAGLSRLDNAAEKKRVKAGLADGSIKIVIGTGAIAAKGVTYADLALVVIDEEQRFGTADKAKLHALGAGHVLTLSATPIPRTLQSALVGLQQTSIIATPPARRQPIRTAIGTFDDAVVRTALLRERSRGGQSFVVVPRIEDMAPIAEKLARLVPEQKLVLAHGKMPAAKIDEAMVGFARGEGHILLATNIIEAGLDVPRANTMIVHHADRFGLSQLHQLRGRVGRGGRRGQILLLTDPETKVAEATLKRLRALQAFDRLGAGFAISARDLDLRGAGDLLGEAQAGHMKLIGIDLYQHLFGNALRAARGEKVDEWRPELRVGLEGWLPQEWIPEAEVRLSLYARLARVRNAAAADALEEELEDRFGALPDAVCDMLRLTRLAIMARHSNIARIDAGPAAIALTPRGKARTPGIAGLEPKDGRWLLAERIVDDEERLERVAALLGELITE